MKGFDVTSQVLAEINEVVQTAAGELILAVMYLGSVVDRMAIASGQDADVIVQLQLQKAAEQCAEAKDLLIAKLPKRI